MTRQSSYSYPPIVIDSYHSFAKISDILVFLLPYIHIYPQIYPNISIFWYPHFLILSNPHLHIFNQALRRILNFLDHNNNYKIRLEDFIDIMDEHNVEFDPEEVSQNNAVRVQIISTQILFFSILPSDYPLVYYFPLGKKHMVNSQQKSYVHVFGQHIFLLLNFSHTVFFWYTVVGFWSPSSLHLL